jgi:hypothetical protein
MGYRRVAATLLCSAAASLIFTTLPAVPSAADQMTASAESSTAAGAAWLSAQISASGAVLDSAGTPKAGPTRKVVLGLLSAKSHQDVVDRAVAWLSANIELSATEWGSASPGGIAELIMIAVGAGKDPRAFGGSLAANDLVARLQASQTTTGQDAGLYGAPNDFGSSFSQGLALAALDAVGISDPLGAAWLAEQQCEDGSWAGYRADPSTPCETTVWPDYAGTDSNGTAAATIGLAAQGKTPVFNVISYFDTHQSETGGWAYNPSTTTAEDADSTAIAIQALTSLGVSVAGDARFTTKGTNPVVRLITFQSNCSALAADRGGFVWKPASDAIPNVLSTSASVIALSGSTLPLARVTSWNGATDVCAPVTTTSTTTSTTTTTAATTTTTTTAATTPTTVPQAVGAQVQGVTSVRYAG